MQSNESELMVPQLEPVLAEPKYPILDAAEVWDGVTDLRQQLSEPEQANVWPDETVIHIQRRGVALPLIPTSPLDVLLKASHALTPDQIGYHGPTVASVSLDPNEHSSRYERQHGRDDLIAAYDVKETYPKLLEAAVISLASTQGITDERFDASLPYGFEKPGAIILVNFSADDPLGKKFADRKGWRSPFYGSADAPGLFVQALALLQNQDSAFLYRKIYTGLDGETYNLTHAFDLAVDWLCDRLDENHEGLIEYRNPYLDGRGMRNQGWKDSADAMVHSDGTWANSQSGVAAIEIQCQAVTALRWAAHVYSSLYKKEAMASELSERAERLRRFILNKAWVDDDRGGHFAMGWDRDEQGRLRRIETRSIDMHYVLRILDLADGEQKAMAWQTVRNLTSEAMLTRWGSRVMAADEKAYGDLRYHCGVWPDKSNRVAESLSLINLPGLDRALGGLTSNLFERVRCYPEHISGADSAQPELPDKDVYVYNRRYNEVHLIEQVPPIGQTWGATSEIAKQYRYQHLPPVAHSEDDRRFETEILASIRDRMPGI